MEERDALLARLHGDLVALQAQKQRHVRVGAYVFVVLLVAALVVADHAWGLGLWVAIREIATHLRP